MTEMQDPSEIYLAALADLPPREETQPPSIRRAEVWPYPDLQRLWVRIEVSPFAAFPNLDLTVIDPAGAIACTMFMVEIRETYQSVTLHLRQPPQPDAEYRLRIALSRDDLSLDEREVTFRLTFSEPARQP